MNTISKKPPTVSRVVKSTIISSFSFLTALALRDTFFETMKTMSPESQKYKLLFTYFYACIIFAGMIMLSIIWYDQK